MYFVNPLSPNIHIQILHTDFHRHFLIDKLTEFNTRSKHFLFVDHLIDSSATISLDNVWILFFFFFFFLIIIILFPQQVLTYIVVVHIVILKSQKSHTRYLISSQGILHFTKQLKNVEMFRVCN